MSDNERSQDVKTPLARLAFSRGLFKLQDNGFGKEQWTAALLFPKSADISVLENAAMEAATAAWGDKAAQMIKDGLIKSPFLDGDGPQGKSKQSGEPHAGFAGHRFIRVMSGAEYRPQLFDQKVHPTDDPALLYSGCYVYAVVNAFTWKNDMNGKGISFSVSIVQKVKDGERMGGTGGPDPNAFLEAVETDDAPAETKTGAGAGGLFG